MGAIYDESVEVIVFSISHFCYHLLKMMRQILYKYSITYHTKSISTLTLTKKNRSLKHPIYHDLITNEIR